MSMGETSTPCRRAGRSKSGHRAEIRHPVQDPTSTRLPLANDPKCHPGWIATLDCYPVIARGLSGAETAVCAFEQDQLPVIAQTTRWRNRIVSLESQIGGRREIPGRGGSVGTPPTDRTDRTDRPTRPCDGTRVAPPGPGNSRSSAPIRLTEVVVHGHRVVVRPIVSISRHEGAAIIGVATRPSRISNVATDHPHRLRRTHPWHAGNRGRRGRFLDAVSHLLVALYKRGRLSLRDTPSPARLQRPVPRISRSFGHRAPGAQQSWGHHVQSGRTR